MVQLIFISVVNCFAYLFIAEQTSLHIRSLFVNQISLHIRSFFASDLSPHQISICIRSLVALDPDSFFTADPDFSSHLNRSSVHSWIQISSFDDVTTAESSISLDDVTTAEIFNLSSAKLSMTSRLLKSSIHLDDVTTAEIFNSLIFCLRC
ncbi:hypothetical protein F511_44517 [Dorcoceras hygrometricum]|uniref:Uncharacterized protein n=1 Tax=Dorcoceras hygrometricum TaxID=472368 RepID=A0A2Z6ZXW6_9LAMI|nr:hypothetical protein F511_44517 [Dorcoceras hygrometricum]